MTDARWISRMGAVLACLADEGVPEPDLIGTARAALLLTAFAEVKTPATEAFLSWLREQPAATPPDPDAPVTRYFRAGGRLKRYLLVIWGEVAATGLDGEDVFSFLWGVLDRLEGERLVVLFEAPS